MRKKIIVFFCFKPALPPLNFLHRVCPVKMAEQVLPNLSSVTIMIIMISIMGFHNYLSSIKIIQLIFYLFTSYFSPHLSEC